MAQRILITGGTGFIGSAVAEHFRAHGWHVIVTSTTPQAQKAGDGATHVQWDGRDVDRLVPFLEGAQAVVHLAGEPILGRWTREKKDRILRSRIESGSALAAAIRKTRKRPKVLVQASAIGYYGETDAPTGDDGALGSSFLSFVCAQWEGSTESVERLGVRRCVARLAPVLGPGGMLAERAKPFQWFVGGPVAPGSQWVSAVHRDDVVKALAFLVQTTTNAGVYNITTPEPCTERTFAQAIGAALHRPSWLTTPQWLVRVRYGELAAELCASQRVVPARLLADGFAFSHTSIPAAVHAAVEKGRKK